MSISKQWIISDCIETGKRIKKSKETVIKSILLLCILACLVTGSVDSLLELRGGLFFWLLSVGYCLPEISKSKKLSLKLGVIFQEQ